MLISVVGNAKSIFNEKNGHLIDNGDIVFRFNAGVIIKPESQGNKTTYVVWSKKLKNEPYLHDFGNAKPYHLPVNGKERIELKKRFGIRPSNGTILLTRLKNTNPNDQIQIFGFDWKATPTWYRENPIKEKHNYAIEKQYCLVLIEEMNWRLY